MDMSEVIDIYKDPSDDEISYVDGPSNPEIPFSDVKKMCIEFDRQHMRINYLDIDIAKVECCICMADYTKKQVVSLRINDMHDVQDNMLFAAPCAKHFICKECFVRVCTDFENHPINERHALVRCMNPFEECVTEAGTCTYFDHAQVRKVLNDEKYRMYREHAEMYAFPGFVSIRCPNSYLDMSTWTVYKRCDAINIIPVEKVRASAPGKLIVVCSQNPHCNYRFCYTCKQRISLLSAVCRSCSNKDESTNPFAFNRYIVKPVGGEGDGYRRVSREEEDYLYRNKDVDADVAREYIRSIIDSKEKRLQMQCPLCLLFFYKSEQCAALSHCGLERCYSCGRIQFSSDTGLGDHWSEIGLGGCPRFDTAPLWKDSGCNFMCRERSLDSDTVCYGHDRGDCDIPEHQAGIDDMNNVRKRAFVYHFVKSLLPEVREEILDTVPECGEFKQAFSYLENNPQFKYHYLPELFLPSPE